MSTLYLMCGIPGSGKTTYIKNNLDNNSVHISRDEIRFSMLDEKDNYFAKEKLVFRKWIEKIQFFLDKGYNVYADATHINKNSRNKTLSNLDLNNHEVKAICVLTDLDTCIERNLLRKGRECVPTDVIKNMFSNFTIPYLTESVNHYKSIIMVKGD